MTNDARQRMFKVIRRNIIKHGHHITSVMGGQSPGYLYTIGLKERLGGELVMAGLADPGIPLAGGLVNDISARLRDGEAPLKLRHHDEELGEFILRPAHPSWTSLLMLGVRDFYQTDEVVAWQIFPVAEPRPIDTPDLSQPFDVEREPVWKWLDEDWPYSWAPDSPVIVDLAALRGAAVSQLLRREEDEWDMLADPNVELIADNLRLLSMASMVALDPSLEAALKIETGTGLFRKTDKPGSPGPWFPWTLTRDDPE